MHQRVVLKVCTGIWKKNKWQVHFGRKHIGYFDNEADAAIAYNQKAIEKFGDIAYVNEI